MDVHGKFHTATVILQIRLRAELLHLSNNALHIYCSLLITMHGMSAVLFFVSLVRGCVGLLVFLIYLQSYKLQTERRKHLQTGIGACKHINTGRANICFGVRGRCGLKNCIA